MKLNETFVQNNGFWRTIAQTLQLQVLQYFKLKSWNSERINSSQIVSRAIFKVLWGRYLCWDRVLKSGCLLHCSHFHFHWKRIEIIYNPKRPKLSSKYRSGRVTGLLRWKGEQLSTPFGLKKEKNFFKKIASNVLNFSRLWIMVVILKVRHF